MRRALARVFQQARLESLLEATFYATAVFLAGWALLVMLRSRLPDHADGLWIVSFAHDVLQRIPLRGWRMPGAPDYFPELFSVVASGSLGFGARSSLLIHGYGSWLAIAAGIYWGLRLGRLSVAASLRIAFLTLLVYLPLHTGSVLLQPFEFPFSHGGAVLVSLFGLLYLAHGFERGFALPGWLCAVFLLGLACASDRANLAQFVAPALLVVLVLAMLRARPRYALAWALGLLLLGPMLGELLTRLIQWGVGFRPGPYGPRFGWSKSVQTLLRMCGDLQALALDRPVLAASVVLPSLFLVWRASIVIGGYARARRRGSVDGLSVRSEAWLACGGVALLSGTLAAVVVTNCWDGPASFRYLLPVFVLPFAFAVMVGAPSYWRLSPGWARLLELSLLFLVVLEAIHTDRGTPHRLATLDSPKRTCLDSFANETGLRAGYAEYWSARPPMLLSQAGITLAQVSGRLRPKWWADNRAWYTRGFWPGQERPRFSFVITEQLDKAWLLDRFGPPHLEHTCFGFELWAYDRPEDVEFRNYLRSGAVRATGDDPEWWPVVGDSKDSEGSDEPGGLRFRGKEGISVVLPHVPANVLEIVSPTRKRLELRYRRAGSEVARQEVEFNRDDRRLLVLPAGLDLRSIDDLLIRGSTKARYKVKQIALMRDPEAEGVRR
jgi:hypothetical protein